MASAAAFIGWGESPHFWVVPLKDALRLEQQSIHASRACTLKQARGDGCERHSVACCCGSRVRLVTASCSNPFVWSNLLFHGAAIHTVMNHVLPAFSSKAASRPFCHSPPICSPYRAVSHRASHLKPIKAQMTASGLCPYGELRCSVVLHNCHRGTCQALPDLSCLVYSCRT